MNNKDVGRWYVSEIPNLFQLEIVLCYITMAFIIINLSMWEIWYISSNFSHVHTQIIQEMSGHLHLGYTIWSHLRVRCQYPKLSPSRFWKWCFGGNFSGYVQLKWNDPWIFHLFPLPNPTLSPNCRLVMTMKFTRLFILFSAPFCILQCFLKHLFPVLIFNDRFFFVFRSHVVLRNQQLAGSILRIARQTVKENWRCQVCRISWDPPNKRGFDCV